MNVKSAIYTMSTLLGIVVTAMGTQKKRQQAPVLTLHCQTKLTIVQRVVQSSAVALLEYTTKWSTAACHTEPVRTFRAL